MTPRVANSPVEIEYSAELKPLADLLEGVKRPGDFYVSGFLMASLPRLDIDGVGTISFPLPDSQAKEIILQAQRAPYGKGELTLVDNAVRKVWQVGPDKLHLGGAVWAKTFETILAHVVRGLGCHRQSPVTAELYKLLLYDTGGLFVSHRDTEKTEGMFGTLVVVLPSLHDGGALVVRHAGREVSLDLETKDVSQLTYAAFYADCEHEVRPVNHGNRLSLIYNLVQHRQERLKAPDYESEIASAAKLIADQIKRPDRAPKIVYLLEHQYSIAGLSFSALKNADSARAKVLSQAAERAGCGVYLGIVHIEEAGSAEAVYSLPYRRSSWREDDDPDGAYETGEDDFEVVEVFDSRQYISDWVDLQDRAIDFGAIPIAKGELFPKGALDDEKPDEQRVMEATGNEGASFERSYRRAAIVLWDEQRYPEVLLQAGAGAAVPYLRKLIQQWGSQSENPGRSALWQRIGSLVELISDRWASAPYSCELSQQGETRTAKRAEMLELLGAAQDAKLLQRFIEKVVVSHYDGSENEQLAASTQLLGAVNIAELFSTIVQKSMPLFPLSCVDLLSRLVGNQSRDPGPDFLAANQKIAEAAVKALSQINPPPVNVSGYSSWRQPKQIEPVEPASVATLFNILRKLEVPNLSDTAAGILIVHPEIFAPDMVLVPALSNLHRQHGDTAADGAFLGLWEHAVQFLLTRSEFPPQPPVDWAQTAKLNCRCPECRGLQSFVEDPARQIHRFRVRKDRRQHLHQTIVHHQLEMTHVTERIGSPQTLVCTKTRWSYEKRLQQYARDIGHFKTLETVGANLPRKFKNLLDRLHQAIGRQRH